MTREKGGCTCARGAHIVTAIARGLLGVRRSSRPNHGGLIDGETSLEMISS